MKLAALDADTWWIEGEAPRKRAHPLGSAAAVFAVMQACSIDVLYVHASAMEGLGLPDHLDVPGPGEPRPRHSWLDCELRGERPSHRALSPSIELGGRELLIGAYQDGAGDPFGDARDGRELLAAAAAFADALKEKGGKRWALRNSAALTGWLLMHAPFERGGRRRHRPLDGATNPQPELEGHPPGAQVEIPYGGKWARAERDTAGLPYVVAFDVNAQRLAACSRLSLGVEGLEHRPYGGGGEDGLRELLKLPGYHFVERVDHPHAGAIPPIFEPGWHTSPRVAMAAYLELEPVVRESWVWTDHLPYLNPFYERMRDAREQLLLARDEVSAAAVTLDGRAAAIALDALKQTYLQPFGRLRSTRLRESRDVRYRPSWYDAIIGQELARQYLRLHELAAAGVPVLAVYFDTIICEVAEPGDVPEQLTLSSQLGKYKRMGEAIATADAHDALYDDAGGYDVGALVRAIKAGAESSPPTPPPRPSAPAPALSALTRPVHGGYPS